MSIANKTVETIIDQLTAKVNERRERESLRFCPRDAHADHHGLVRAEFTVGRDVPANLRHGIFASPKRYEAYIRFSNAGGEAHDADIDFRGMAIKVVGVEGKRSLPTVIPEDERTSQDFILVNCPVFFVENAERMVEFLECRRQIRTAVAERRWLVALRLEFALQRRFAGTKRAGIIRNPFTTAYFSQTAYRLGPESNVVKYCARPPRVDSWWASRDDPRFTMIMRRAALSALLRRWWPADYLRSAMHATLLRGEDVVFDFGVQRQLDPSTMPTDDPTVEWDERRSPFVTVATIRIPARDNADFIAPERMNAAETVCFNPWHSLDAHEPLGSVNRARLEVYRRMAHYRHAENHVRYEQPEADRDVEARSPHGVDIAAS